MSSEPNRDELRRAMDACRADSRDLSLPEMDVLAERLTQDPACAAEFAKTQRQDRLLHAALEDVPIPPGLIERTLSGMASKRPELSLREPVAVPDALAKAANSSRRRYLALGFTAAAAVLLAVMFGTYWAAPKVGSVARLREEAAGLLTTPEGVAWSTDIAKPAVSYPYERWLRVVPKRWRAVTLGGDRGVLYDLVGVDEGGAILIVISTAKRYDLPGSPEIANVGGSSGLRRQVAWKQASANSGLVYVLTMGDRQGDPQQLLRPLKLALGHPNPQAFASR